MRSIAAPVSAWPAVRPCAAARAPAAPILRSAGTEGRRHMSRREVATFGWNSDSSWCCLLIEEFVVVVLQQILDPDALLADQRFSRDQHVAEVDGLVAVQQLAADLHQQTILGEATLCARLVVGCFALEFRPLGILGPCHGGRFLVGGFPLLQRLVAFGEARIELLDGFVLLLFELLY